MRPRRLGYRDANARYPPGKPVYHLQPSLGPVDVRIPDSNESVHHRSGGSTGPKWRCTRGRRCGSDYWLRFSHQRLVAGGHHTGGSLAGVLHNCIAWQLRCCAPAQVYQDGAPPDQQSIRRRSTHCVYWHGHAIAMGFHQSHCSRAHFSGASSIPGVCHPDVWMDPAWPSD